MKGSIHADLGLLLMRLMLATVFMFHGSQKLFGLFEGPGLEGFSKVLESQSIPQPMVAAVLAGLAEFAGGLALVLGFFFRWAILPLLITMGVAVVVVHGNAFDGQKGGMEYPLTLGVFLIALWFTGPGSYSMKSGDRG